jgi:hypothetical protein
MTTLAELKALKTHFMVGSSILRKLFMTSANNKGVRQEGYSLNGNALVRSFTSARSCRENSDRFISQVKKPLTRCAFSFAIDFSGSMTSSPSGSRQDTFLGVSSSWQRVIGSLYALTHVAESIGIKSKVGFVQFEEGFFEVGVIKDFEQKAWNEATLANVLKLYPHSGTCIADYARASIFMLENVQAENKVAFFLTDGADYWSSDYYHSLNELAKSKGIKLVGIAFTTDKSSGEDLPNGVAVADTKKLGDVIFKHLESIVRA